MFDGILEALRSAFETWGYAIVGVGAMLENSVGLGLLVPGETLVLLGGFHAARGILSAPLVAAVAAVGQLIGDLAGYAIGRRVGRRILERPGRVLLPSRVVHAAERYYGRHGRKTLVVGRLVPGIRTILPLLAGTGRMPIQRFLAYDALGSVLWASIHTTLGYLIGAGYPVVRRYAGAVGIVALLLLALLVAWSAGWVASRRIRSDSSN